MTDSLNKTPTLSISEVAGAALDARARIKDHIYKTPLIPAGHLSQLTNSRVLLKAENFQITGSFKLRGAFNKMKSLLERNTGEDLRLLTASSGNHGIACAYAANTLDQNCLIVLPETVSPLKRERIRSLGSEILLHGVESGETEKHARSLAIKEGYTYISPYNDPDIVAGQGSISIELLEQMGAQKIDNIFVAMGGGGLISGVGAVLKQHNKSTKVWGVAAENSATLADSLEAGKVIDTEHFPTLADGVFGGMDYDSVTFPLAQQIVDEVVYCSEPEIEAAFRQLALYEHQIVEGSAALALAALTKVAERCADQNNVVLLCASNIAEQYVLRLLNEDPNS